MAGFLFRQFFTESNFMPGAFLSCMHFLFLKHCGRIDPRALAYFFSFANLISLSLILKTVIVHVVLLLNLKKLERLLPNIHGKYYLCMI